MKVVFDSDEWIDACSAGTLIVIGEMSNEERERLSVMCPTDYRASGRDSVTRYLFWDRAKDL